MPDEDADYGLVMPFVTVASKGGPHDDQAYVAGYEMGKLDVELLTGLDAFERTIRTDNVPQADLLAMRHGWKIESEATEYDEWTTILLNPIPAPQFDGLRQGVDHQAEDQADREDPDGKDGHPVAGLSGSLTGEQPLGRRSHRPIMPYDQTAQYDGDPGA